MDDDTPPRETALVPPNPATADGASPPFRDVLRRCLLGVLESSGTLLEPGPGARNPLGDRPEEPVDDDPESKSLGSRGHLIALVESWPRTVVPPKADDDGRSSDGGPADGDGEPSDGGDVLD